MADKELFVAVPAYTGMVHADTCKALMESLCDAIVRGWGFGFRVYPGNSIVARARNTIVSDFLHSDATDLVFIDADVVWEPGAVCRLADYPVDVVAGVYPHRCDPLTWPVRYIAERPELIADPDTGLLEVAGVPGGFLRITRACLERMIEAYPHLIYNDMASITKKAHALFYHPLEGEEFWGEDFDFCNKWRAIGGRVWIDPMLHLQHIGNKTFTGCLGEWLQARPDCGLEPDIPAQSAAA